MALEHMGAAPPVSAAGSGAVRTGLVAALIVALSVASHLAAPLTGDVSWLITVCERLLAGQSLYVDIFELNPPMSAWIYLPWVALAHVLGVKPELTVTLAVIGFGAAMIQLAGTMLRRAGLLDGAALWWVVAGFACLLAPVMTFAQREHVAVMAVLPLLAAIAARAEGRGLDWRTALAAGLFGGLALAIKPHFALAVIPPVLYAAARRRSVRPVFAPENIVAGAIPVVYLAVVMATQPAFFTDMLPIANTIYVPNRRTLWQLVTAPRAMTFGLLVAALWVVRRDLATKPLFVVLTSAAIGFAAAYLLQGRGWPYHLLPGSTLAIIAFGLAAAAPWPQATAGGRQHTLARIVSVSLAAFLVIAPAVELSKWRGYDAPLTRALEPLGHGLKIALISGDLALASPLHRSIGATLINRGPSLWLTGNALPLCHRSTDEAQLAACRDAQIRERAMLLEDLRKSPPDAILAEATLFDWIRWARRDPELAKFLDGYRLVEEVRHGYALTRVLAPVSR